MATTIINPATSNNPSSNSGMGLLMGAAVLVLFGVIFFVFVLPYIRGFAGNGGVQVNIPVPKTINVNVQQPK